VIRYREAQVELAVAKEGTESQSVIMQMDDTTPRRKVKHEQKNRMRKSESGERERLFRV